MKTTLTKKLLMLAAVLGISMAASIASANGHGRGGTLHVERSVTVERHHAPAARHVTVTRSAAPVHYRAEPVHVVRQHGPSPGYLRDSIRDAERYLRRAELDARGAETPRVEGYLREANAYLERAERMYFDSPRRFAREIERNAERAQDSARAARDEAIRYQREVQEMVRTTRLELQRVADDVSFYRARDLRYDLRDARSSLQRAQSLASQGRYRAAHRELDDARVEIRRVERELNQYGYFSRR